MKKDEQMIDYQDEHILIRDMEKRDAKAFYDALHGPGDDDLVLFFYKKHSD